MSAKQSLLEASPGAALPGVLVKIGLAQGRPDFLNPTVAPVRGLSLRSNFTWALAGNVVYADLPVGHDRCAGKIGQLFYDWAILPGTRDRHARSDVHESSSPGSAGKRRPDAFTPSGNTCNFAAL